MKFEIVKFATQTFVELSADELLSSIEKANAASHEYLQIYLRTYLAGFLRNYQDGLAEAANELAKQREQAVKP